MKADLRAAAAHHQSGHVVARWALGLPFSEVLLLVRCQGEPLPGWAADVTAQADEGRRALAGKHIVALLAGPEAERRFRAHTILANDRAVAEAAQSDREGAEALAQFAVQGVRPVGTRTVQRVPAGGGHVTVRGYSARPFTPAEIEEFLDRGCAQAADLVGVRWTLVAGLADELLGRGEMDAERVREYLDARP